MKNKIYSVWEISEQIKKAIEKEEFCNLWIEGEISNFREAIGNYFFDLKDEKAIIKCVMFSPSLPFTPKNGMKVIIKGDIRVYEKRGYYQVYVQDIKVGGIGELFMKFIELKEKLQKEGIFDEKFKRPLPKTPSKIGVVTSPNGSAIKDIQKVISRRFPVTIVLAPVRVQGEGSAEEIERAIKALNSRKDIELIIVGRGGGSWEDLWAFNDERVARAIFESRIPVISAVGHETDFTIADFVADRRAPTPSAAGEIAVPDREEMIKMIENYAMRMIKIARGKIDFYREISERIMKRRAFSYPFEIIYDKIECYKKGCENLNKAIDKFLEDKKTKIRFIEENLRAMNPYKVLERGYSICFRLRDNKLFSSVDDAEVGENIKIVVKDGEAICRMKEKKKK